MNIIEKTDEEILAIGNPLWCDLIKYSNEGQYGEFVKNFSASATEVVYIYFHTYPSDSA